MSEPIPPGDSAYLNLNTAGKDIEYARWMWEDNDIPECIRNITEAIKQLESAKAKLEKLRIRESEAGETMNTPTQAATPITNAMLSTLGLRCNCAEKPIELCMELELKLASAQAENARTHSLLLELRGDYDHPWPDEDEDSGTYRVQMLAEINDALGTESATESKRQLADISTLRAELAYVKLQRDRLLEITWLDLPSDPSESTARWQELFNEGWERKEMSDELREQVATLERERDEAKIGSELHDEMLGSQSELYASLITLGIPVIGNGSLACIRDTVVEVIKSLRAKLATAEASREEKRKALEVAETEIRELRQEFQTTQDLMMRKLSQAEASREEMRRLIQYAIKKLHYNADENIPDQKTRNDESDMAKSALERALAQNPQQP